MMIGVGMKGGILSALFIVFALWVAIGNGPGERIERSCKPVVWFGNLSVSVMQLIDPKFQNPTQRTFDKFDYGCRFSLWRLFFEKEYLKELERKAEAPAETVIVNE